MLNLYDIKEYLINECLKDYCKQENHLQNIKIIDNNFILKYHIYSFNSKNRKENITISLKSVMESLGIPIYQRVYKEIIVNDPDDFSLPE